jgi:type II secretory pathway pseudopilin PulG
MKKNKRHNRCFSLAETVIATAILIFVLVALLALFNNFFKTYSSQKTKIDIGNSAREAVKELKNAALQANQIAASHNFSGTTYSSDQYTLVLEIPSIDGSGNIVSGKYDYAVFYLTGTNLYRRIQADAASSRPSALNKISDVVSTITFTYNNADLALATKIDVDMEMQKISGGQNVSYQLHQEIYLRNK